MRGGGSVHIEGIEKELERGGCVVERFERKLIRRRNGKDCIAVMGGGETDNHSGEGEERHLVLVGKAAVMVMPLDDGKKTVRGGKESISDLGGISGDEAWILLEVQAMVAEGEGRERGLEQVVSEPRNLRWGDKCIVPIEGTAGMIGTIGMEIRIQDDKMALGEIKRKEREGGREVGVCDVRKEFLFREGIDVVVSDNVVAATPEERKSGFGGLKERESLGRRVAGSLD